MGEKPSFRANSVITLLTVLCFFILWPLKKGEAQSKVQRIVIDAGHGGKDPGNLGTGRYKTKEKDIALNVSLKLGGYIKEAYPDIKVIYTRDNDSFISLSERAAVANRNKADLFISIHCNSAGSSSAAGTETFVMGFKYEKQNLALTKMENSVIYLEEDYENKYEDLDPGNPEADMLAELYQSAYQDQSITFANYVEQQFAERVGRNSRGVKQAVLRVLYRSTMPSVLVELGFLTNRKEEDFLNSDLGQVYMASAIYRAFKDWKSLREAIDNDQYKAQPVAVEPRKPDVDNTSKQVGANPYGVVFKIQLLSSSRKVNIGKELSGIDEVEEMELAGRFKYLHGSFDTYNDAKKALKKVRRKDGLEAAFVVAIKDKKQLSIKDALDEQKK